MARLVKGAGDDVRVVKVESCVMCMHICFAVTAGRSDRFTLLVQAHDIRGPSVRLHRVARSHFVFICPR